MDHEYAFDIKLLAAIRVRANSEAEARAKLRDALQCADSNFGQTSDGQTLTAEATIDGELDLYEIDGEAAD